MGTQRQDVMIHRHGQGILSSYDKNDLHQVASLSFILLIMSRSEYLGSVLKAPISTMLWSFKDWDMCMMSARSSSTCFFLAL